MKKESKPKSPNAKTRKMPFDDADAALAAAISDWWNVNAEFIVQGDEEMLMSMLRSYTHDESVFIRGAVAKCSGDAQVAERTLRIIEMLARFGHAVDAEMIYDICKEAGEVYAAKKLGLDVARFNDPLPFFDMTDEDAPF